MKELAHFIAGKHVKGTSGRFGDVFNPATGEVQARVRVGQQGARCGSAVEAALQGLSRMVRASTRSAARA